MKRLQFYDSRGLSKLAIIGVIAVILVVAAVATLLIVNQPRTVRIELGVFDPLENIVISDRATAAAGDCVVPTGNCVKIAPGKPSWAFTIGDQRNPTILVKLGDTIELALNAKGAKENHDFTIDELGVNFRTTYVLTGQLVTVTFKADKTGTFTYYCSQVSHKELGMKGSFVVS